MTDGERGVRAREHVLHGNAQPSFRGIPDDGMPIPTAELVGRRVALRPLTVQDTDWILALSSTPSQSFRWRGSPGSIDPRGVQDFLWQGVFCQFVITHKTSGAPLGLVVAYGADMINRHVKLAIALDEHAISLGWPLEAAQLFIDYLFQLGDFRKIYGEIHDFNTPLATPRLRSVVHEEGRLVQHTYVAGQYRDQIITAIYRDEWQANRKRRLDRYRAARSTKNAETREGGSQ